MTDSQNPEDRSNGGSGGDGAKQRGIYSFGELAGVCRRRWRILTTILIGVPLLCLLYCVVAAKQYEASARVALRMQGPSSLSLEGAETVAPASILSAPLQLETLVNVLRSERLGWTIVTKLRLYDSPGFARRFARDFPDFDVRKPTPAAQSYLLERFGKNLSVRAMPRTLLIEIRFRSADPALAAQVVNQLLESYVEIERQSSTEATGRDSAWLAGQLSVLTAELDEKERHLAEFEHEHGFLSPRQATAGGQGVDALQDPAMLQINETGRMLAVAKGDRILREALYREARAGSPEQVLAANAGLQAEMGPAGGSLVQQLRARASEVSVQIAQLKAEHGPNFPQVVELERAFQELTQQLAVEDVGLVEAFRRVFTAAEGREELLQKQFDEEIEAAIGRNDASLKYAVMLQQVESGRALCARLEGRIREAGLIAGVHASSITVVDYAREPFKPVTPNVPLYLGISVFASVWAGLALVLGIEAVWPSGHRLRRVALGVLFLVVGLGGIELRGWGQAPTPNISGLPSGVVVKSPDSSGNAPPNAKDAPVIWNSAAASGAPGAAQSGSEFGARAAGVAMALPIGAGDFLEVSEFHAPELHSSMRVAADGTVNLPLAGQVRVVGLSEPEASRSIEKALIDSGMLLHPQVSVMVTSAVGQDVSVMGEVTRPGVYPFTVHHRLLDLIAASSGLAPNAGRLVSIFHRSDTQTGHAVVLDPSGLDRKSEHNPELVPGDTILVSRAGLAYVIGDVVRPGGFAVDPAQGLTVVQAISLAWGATPNASASKAILIRDQAGGRTLTTLNLHRMIRGEDPDQPVRDRDILFVPDSATKALLNKSLESAIQSAIGVTIYAGLVYSQRF